MDTFFEIPSVHHRSRRNLTNQQRQLIFEMLLMKVQQGKLKRGSIPEVAAAFGANPKIVRRIWQRAMACFTNGLAIDVSSKLPTHVGRKPKQFDVNRIAEIDLRQRTSLRSLSMALNMPKTTLYRRVKKGHIRPHTNALKPYLSNDLKRARLQFCLSMLEPSNLYTQPTFKNMYNYVHIDEKWFFMTKETERYYLLLEEHEPLRTCKRKQFITKIMFLAAIARPRYDPSRNQEFLGKIGIFPFTFTEPAKRRSKSRAAGTLETKAVIRVTKEIIRTCLIENVLPAIRAKWPRCIDG
ncbi:hypothetical protein Vadar_026428 [Vaccinium darrowii]|uniref:Uncharacterized protein n=1 Tax=Vaccinium darrowii TaxID=229202 RepID=A0ACB7Y1R4_9ERIC|nr:hypothetical protein Vadar_026428 [Vaccinium darrowii]